MFCLGAPSGDSTRRWAASAGLAGPDGQPLQVSLRRLRRTVQVLIRREPAQNSEQTHESAYVLRDPAALPEAEQVTAQGLSDAVRHARATMRMRMLLGTGARPARDRGRRTAAGAGGRRAGHRHGRVPGLHEQPVRPARPAVHRLVPGLPGMLQRGRHPPAPAPPRLAAPRPGRAARHRAPGEAVDRPDQLPSGPGPRAAPERSLPDRSRLPQRSASRRAPPPPARMLPRARRRWHRAGPLPAARGQVQGRPQRRRDPRPRRRGPAVDRDPARAHRHRYPGAAHRHGPPVPAPAALAARGAAPAPAAAGGIPRRQQGQAAPHRPGDHHRGGKLTHRRVHHLGQRLRPRARTGQRNDSGRPGQPGHPRCGRTASSPSCPWPPKQVSRGTSSPTSTPTSRTCSTPASRRSTRSPPARPRCASRTRNCAASSTTCAPPVMEPE